MPKRYESREELVAKIDEFIAERNQIMKEVEDLNQLADALRNTTESYRIEGLRAKAQARLLRANWRTRRLESLKGALAELDTPDLPNISVAPGVMA